MSQSHGHSDYIIFSVYQASLSEGDNQINHYAVCNTLDCMGVNYKECDGVYMGESEKSFIVNANNVQLVQDLCAMHNQECYLLAETHMHGLRKASFVYPDGRKEHMGYLRSVAEHVALKAVGYTYRPDLDMYWIITESDEVMLSA